MGEIMELPMDLMMKILIQFPAKTLLQFKSVCKLWNQLISSDHFATLHLEQTLTLPQSDNPNIRFIFSSPYLSSAEYDTFNKVTELNYPFRNTDHGYVDVVGSCHGLLCLYHFVGPSKTILLYNPTTQTHKKIPLKPSRVGKVSCFGFGYDCVSMDYKFVWIQLADHKSTESPPWSKVMVYSFKACSWTKVGDVPRSFLPRRKDGVLVDGTLHWVHTVFDGIEPHHSVVSFNLGENTFGVVTQPLYEENPIALYVGMLDGCLCLLANDLDETDIWVMKEYGVVGSWTKLFRVKPLQTLLFFEWPIAFSRDRRELFLQVSCWKVVSLDVETMVVKMVEICDFPKYFDTQVCVGNLMMLKDSGSETPEIDAKHGKRRRVRCRRHKQRGRNQS